MQQSEYLSSWLKIIGLIVIVGSLYVFVSQLREIREYNAAVDQAKTFSQNAYSSVGNEEMRNMFNQQIAQASARLVKRAEWESGYVLVATLLGIGCVVFSRKLGGLLADRPG